MKLFEDHPAHRSIPRRAEIASRNRSSSTAIEPGGSCSPSRALARFIRPMPRHLLRVRPGEPLALWQRRRAAGDATDLRRSRSSNEPGDRVPGDCSSIPGAGPFLSYCSRKDSGGSQESIIGRNAPVCVRGGAAVASMTFPHGARPAADRRSLASPSGGPFARCDRAERQAGRLRRALDAAELFRASTRAARYAGFRLAVSSGRLLFVDRARERRRSRSRRRPGGRRGRIPAPNLRSLAPPAVVEHAVRPYRARHRGAVCRRG